MKKILMLLAAAACLTAVSCEKEDENGSSSIVGEWSGVSSIEEKGNAEAVVVHFNFKEDGTYEQIMPAWANQHGEKDTGTYTVKDNVVTFKLTGIAWIKDDSSSGYDNIYDSYGCYWNPDKYAENRTKYADPFNQYCINWPDRANSSAKYSFDKSGNLYFETVSGAGPGFGRPLVYYKNPGFKPVLAD